MNHKKAILTGVLALLLALPAAAQKVKTVSGQGRYMSRAVQELGAFKAVEVRGDIEVDFMQRPNVAVTVSGPENLVRLSNVYVENGVLIIGYTQPVRVRGERNLRVAVSAPELAAVTVDQNGEFEVRGSLDTQTLALKTYLDSEFSADHIQATSVTIEASDRSDVDLGRVSADRVEAVAHNRAEVDLSGDVEEAVLTNNGSGDVDAEDLRAVTVTATGNASGAIKVFPTEALYATANGRGRIEYKGYPTTLETNGNYKKIRRDRDDDHDYDDDDYDYDD